MKILVVEDDTDIRTLIAHHLRSDGYEVSEAEAGQKALRLLAHGFYDLVLLDWTLPDLSGLEICQDIRRSGSINSKLPILMVTARTSDADIVLGLSMGADDYLPKPFSIPVLLARVRALLRRTMSKNDLSEKQLHFGKLFLNTVSHRVVCDGTFIDLSPLEFKLLWALMKNAGVVLARERLVELVQGPDIAVGSRSIDVHVSGLRQKLGPCSEMIETIRGIGYRFRHG